MREFEKRELGRRELEEKLSISPVWQSKEREERETKCVGPTSFLFLFWYEKKGKGTNFLF
jgi:hypothetical protein